MTNRNKVLAAVAGVLLVFAPITLWKLRPLPDGAVEIREKFLPIAKLHDLREGDELVYVLPNGRRLIWLATADGGFTEQTTSSGLKAHCQEPDFDERENSGVSTSGHHRISIYRFAIDGYRVERAEDLAASHSLPVIIRISKLDGTLPLSHDEARAQFAGNLQPHQGEPRVPIETVRYGLIETFSFPTQVVMMDGTLELRFSGDLYRFYDRERDENVREIKTYVVARWDQIPRVDEFKIVVLERERPAYRYVAVKNAADEWSLRLLE